MDGLIEGRIVHYVAYNQRHLAALVIGCEEHRADLAVFTNMKNVAGTQNFGLQFHQDVAYSESKEPGTWHWIEGSPGQRSVNVQGNIRQSVIITGDGNA